MTTYIIKFTIEPSRHDEAEVAFYVGKAPDGSLGWAPTPKTAMMFDTKEDAERMMRNGYGKLAEIGRVIALEDAS